MLNQQTCGIVLTLKSFGFWSISGLGSLIRDTQPVLFLKKALYLVSDYFELQLL